jgi:hypothetical protein
MTCTALKSMWGLYDIKLNLRTCHTQSVSVIYPITTALKLSPPATLQLVHILTFLSCSCAYFNISVTVSQVTIFHTILHKLKSVHQIVLYLPSYLLNTILLTTH